jgi:glucokinase
MARRDHWVGVDFGGSKTLAVVFDDEFRPVARKRKRTKAQEGPQRGLERIGELIEQTLREADVGADRVAAIGVGCAGPLDLDRGIVLAMPNVGWHKLRLRAALQSRFGCPAVLCNDVDAGLFGEYRFGAAKNARCAVGVFVGTGIGGAAVYEGKLIRGKSGSCMEIGHLPVQPEGPLCGCGRRGCLEAVAGRLAMSAQAAAAAYRGDAPHLAQIAGTDLGEIRSRTLADAVAAGDHGIQKILVAAARWIGWAMAGVVNLLAPDVVVLGGGVITELSDLLVPEVEQAMRERAMPAFAAEFRVRASQLSDDATSTGAAAWAQLQVASAAS